MSTFGHLMSGMLNSLVLSIIYILVIGPTAFLARLKKKHFLVLEIQKGARSYWTDLNLGVKPLAKYFKQF